MSTLTPEKLAEYRERCGRAWCRVPCSKEELLSLLDALAVAEADAAKWRALPEGAVGRIAAQEFLDGAK